MTTPAPAARGRRPGGPDTRGEILDAARRSFAQRGFRGTTVRGVAAAAGVDSALVHHYFGTKSDLFLAAAAVPVDPRALLGAVFADGTPGAAQRLLSTMLGVWDQTEMQDRLVALVRSGLGGDPAGEQMLRDAVSQIILATVREHLPPEEADVRVVLVASQLVGLIVARYVLRLPPIATMPRERVVGLVAPNLQRYLDGPLG
jgi:AcrR family transcriptional regulator